MQGGLGPKLPCNTFGFVHFNHFQISHRPAESVRYFYVPRLCRGDLSCVYGLATFVFKSAAIPT